MGVCDIFTGVTLWVYPHQLGKQAGWALNFFFGLVAPNDSLADDGEGIGELAG